MPKFGVHTLAVFYLVVSAITVINANNLFQVLLIRDKTLECKHITFEPSVLLVEENVDVYFVDRNPQQESAEFALTSASETHETMVYKTIQNLSVNDRELLARMAYCEAYSEGEEGMKRVIDVVLNRRDSSKFPNSIRDIIFAEGQFDCVNTTRFKGYVPSGVYKLVDEEMAERIDTESLYFARKPVTDAHVYKFGKHYFSK